jgi:TLC domain
MLDPFFPPPPWLQDLVTPWAASLKLYSLPYHIHEVILAFGFYQLIHSYVSPWLSRRLFPRQYLQLPKRTQLNWDIHVVSLVQSVLVNVVALWVMFADRERSAMTIDERVHGYTGAGGLVQALATGYFIYDLIVSIAHIKLFGIGMLFHAISALCVFSLGFVS